MNHQSSLLILLSSVVIIFLVSIMIMGNFTMLVRGANTAPTPSDAGAYTNYGDEGTEYIFTVVYRDPDGDEGEVFVHIDSNDPVKLRTIEPDPVEGQYFEVVITDLAITDDSEFRFSANDSNGGMVYLPSEAEDPYLFGDFDGWGEPPVLSNPGVYFDGDDWVFNVTYRDPDGDEARTVQLILEDEVYITMATTGTDPLAGQVYTARVLEDQVNRSTRFYFSVDDVNGSYSDLYDVDHSMFEVDDLLVQDGNGGGNGNGNGGGDGNGGTDDDGDNDEPGFAEGWLDNPEVIIGIVGLVAILAGSAYGVYYRRKKLGRFSELLTRLDDVYGSYKMNPKRCETELEKMKATINEDLKKGVIDENNYTILKNRIDEILGEIRSEALRSQVPQLPKDIELKIKDMLIDGEISREEYDKIMPVIKGSDMAKADKEKMRKMVKSWVKDGKR